jgi:hypothetical protein
MARPITWQDVAAPRGLAVAVEAFGRGGDRLAQAVGNVGQIAVDYRDARVKEATDAAVAGITNSQDPTAAASAVPKDWTIDPLAIAVAANARGKELQQVKLADETILASKAQREMSEANLQDLIDTRDAEAIAQRNWENSAKAGRVVLGDDDANMGQASLKAGAILSSRLDQLQDNQRADRQVDISERELGLRAKEANLRIAALNREVAVQDYYSWAREFGASAEAQRMDPKELDRVLVAKAKERNLPVTYADTAAGYFGKGVDANSATDAELDQRIPGQSRTYRDALTTLSTVAADTQSQIQAIKARPYDESNPDNPDPNRPSLLQLQEVATRGPGFTDGPIGQVAADLAAKADISQSEARERITAIKAEYRHLSEAQAADLAFQSKDRWNFFGDFNVTQSPEVKAGALIYREVDRLGGKEGLAQIEARVTAPLQRTLGEVSTTARQLSGSARGRTDVPVRILEWDSKLATARSKAASEKAAEEATAAQKALEQARKRAEIAERR